MGQGPWKHFGLVFAAKHSTLSLTFGWKQKKHTSRLLRWRHSTTGARASTALFTAIKNLSEFNRTCCDMQHFSPCPSLSLDIYRHWDSSTWSVLNFCQCLIRINSQKCLMSYSQDKEGSFRSLRCCRKCFCTLRNTSLCQLSSSQVFRIFFLLLLDCKGKKELLQYLSVAEGNFFSGTQFIEAGRCPHSCLFKDCHVLAGAEHIYKKNTSGTGIKTKDSFKYMTLGSQQFTTINWFPMKQFLSDFVANKHLWLRGDQSAFCHQEQLRCATLFVFSA